jgi:hypothetical protein
MVDASVMDDAGWFGLDGTWPMETGCNLNSMAEIASLLGPMVWMIQSLHVWMLMIMYSMDMWHGMY